MMHKKDIEEIIVLDLETKNLIPKGSDWEQELAFQNFRISIICVYSYLKDKYLFFTLDTIDEFLSLLKKANIIVGFNYLTLIMQF